MVCQAPAFMSRVSRGTPLSDLTLRAGYGLFRLNERAHKPGDVTQTELANRVGARTGRSFTQTAAAGWLSGGAPRDLETMEALAIELDLDPNWLYFNRGNPPEGFTEWAERVNWKSPYVPKPRPRKRQDQTRSTGTAKRRPRGG